MNFWKIGTNIERYVNDYFNFYKLFNHEYFYIGVSNEKAVITNSAGAQIVEKSQSTIYQMLRIYMSLGLIEPKDNTFISSKEDAFDARYIAKNNIKEALEQRLENYINDGIQFYDGEDYTLFCMAMSALYFYSGDKQFVLNSLNNDSISQVELGYFKIGNFSDRNIISKFKIIAKYDFRNKLREENFYMSDLTFDEFKKINSFEHSEGIKERENIIAENSEFCNETKERQKIKSVVITFGEFLDQISVIKNAIYSIPVYQRNYVWDTRNCEKLIKEVISIDDGRKYLYLNSIILKSEVNSQKIKNRIIDGQQRLTTLILFARAIYDYAKETNNYGVKSLFAYYFKKDSLDSDTYIVKNFTHIDGNLELSSFRAIINGNGAVNYDTNYYKNYQFFMKQLESLNSEKLISLALALLYKVLMTITNDEIDDEMKLFESVNTNSVPLNTIDLFKNFSLSLVKEDILNNNERELQSLFESKVAKKFSASSGKDLMEKFIDVYLRLNGIRFNTFDKFESFKKLFEQYKPNSCTLEVYEKKILSNLSEKATLYNLILFKDKHHNTYCFKHISDILFALSNRDIYLPLLMHIISLYYEYNPLKESFDFKYEKNLSKLNELRRILFQLERFEMVFQVVFYRGQSLTETMNTILKKAKELGNSLNVENFISILNSIELVSETINYDKDKFVAKMNDHNFKSNDSACKVLVRLDNFLRFENIELNKFDEIILIENPSREHIMPDKIEKWEEYLKSKYGDNYIRMHNDIVNKIGNSILMKKDHNSEVGNKTFYDKKRSYENVEYLKQSKTYGGCVFRDIELKPINLYPEWTAQTIEERTEKLSKICAEIWLDQGVFEKQYN